MTKYELMRWLTFPIMPVHLQTVRHHIKQLVKETTKDNGVMEILDVGGRKSPYTIGIDAKITLLDVPQEAGTREALHLGFTKDILTTIQKKRSNIKDLLIQDMTQSTIEEASYDAVISVEVIEHIVEDELFVKNIAKVIKPGGWAYLTTPNGDYIKNTGPDKNPDHVRHYTKEQLQAILEAYFDRVEVFYAVKTGKYRVQGLKSYRFDKPFRTIKSIFANIINSYQSKGVAKSPKRTAHLIAIAYKEEDN
jgi:2-polyprenyl-3-methyl-5-hydroxy-6-metoxy-1,4-benzoquinol methylase